MLFNLFRKKQTSEYWELLRLLIGFIFLWAFLDKTFGLGFPTVPESAWLNGTSPTSGFLLNQSRGLFEQLFKSLAGNPVVDWVFMLGLLGVGSSLLLGIGTKIAGYAGALMMGLIYLASFPPRTNPGIDQHIIYIVILLAFTQLEVGNIYGLRSWWKKQDIVKKNPWLE